MGPPEAFDREFVYIEFCFCFPPTEPPARSDEPPLAAPERVCVCGGWGWGAWGWGSLAKASCGAVTSPREKDSQAEDTLRLLQGMSQSSLTQNALSYNART